MTRTVFTILTALLLVFPFSSASHAMGNVKVGDTIPHDLALKDSNGKMHNFSDLKGDNGLVLVFIRSAEWCPFCQKQVIELNDNVKKFKEAGYPVVTVSYDPVEQLAKFTSKNNTKITMLSDPASASIRAFGILNEASAKGTFSYGIPHPIVYIVSKDKKVQAMFFKEDYTKRPSAKELLAKITELTAPPEPSLDEMGQDPILPGEEVITTPEKITEPVVVPDETMPPATDELDVAPMVAPTPEQDSMKEPAPETTAPVATPAPTGAPVDSTADFGDFDLPPMPETTDPATAQ